MRPKLLIVELWGLGDLLIATPFLRAAAKKYTVTLVAKPYALGLRDRFWPDVQVIPFVAPWTAFTRKYLLYRWPWRGLFRLCHSLRVGEFDIGISARWDPRDHLLLWLVGARDRLGFPRVRSDWFLTRSLERPGTCAHRYEYWRILADALNLTLPPHDTIPMPRIQRRDNVLIHSGAGQPVRVWPLERYRSLIERLRARGYQVTIACDADQREWWLRAGEENIATPRTVKELLAVIDQAGAFVGNDSGPGHLAAFCGLPTLTIFGPQLPEWFSPLHPESVALAGKACPYKPCSDYCRFPTPRCLWGISEEETWLEVERFVTRHYERAQCLGNDSSESAPSARTPISEN